jgi:hypothetical protein
MNKDLWATALAALAMCALFGVALAVAITPALLIAKWLGAWP